MIKTKQGDKFYLKEIIEALDKTGWSSETAAKELLLLHSMRNPSFNDTTNFEIGSQSPDSIILPPKKTGLTLAIPDLHAPFHHPDAFDFLQCVNEEIKPDNVVDLGDELDFHAISRWPSDPDGLSAGQELAAGIAKLIPLYKIFAKVQVCTSNHTIRPFKKAFESGLPAAMMPSYKTLMNAPEGWEWAHSHIIDGVRYIHGEGRSGQYAHMAFMRGYKMSTVIGHIHSYAGVNYEGSFFGMNAGCLIDVNAYAFKYAKNFAVPVSLGCGIVRDGKDAMFLPMHVNSENRWIGKLRF